MFKHFYPTVACLALLLSLVPVGSTAAVAPEAQSKAWEILHSGLNHGRVDKRCQAIRALGVLFQDSEAVEVAEKALQDEHPEIRTAAAFALGEMRSTVSIAQLKKALSDHDTSVALAAAHSLVLLKEQAGYDIYYAVLTGERKGGEGLEVMVHEQMQIFGDPKKVAEFAFEQGIGFVPYGGYAFDAVKTLKKGKDASPVRAAAARALVDDPDPRSGHALAKAVHDPKWVVRGAALWALGKRGDPNFLPAAEAALSDDNDAVRYIAAASVLRLTKVPQLDKSAGKQ
jgi:HEAT repeat protein